MKVFSIIAAGILLLCSCGPTLIERETFNLGTPTEALDWISTHIHYVSDGDHDHWQLPSETMRLGTGDCEDFAILFLSALNAQGIKRKIIGIKVDWYPPPSTNKHAVVGWNDQWWTVERGNAGGLPWGLYPELWEKSFQQALDYAEDNK